MSYTFVAGALTYEAFIVKADAFTDEYESAEILLIGRGRRVETGTRWGLRGTLTVQIYDQPGLTAAAQVVALRTLRAAGVTVVMTDAFGTATNVRLGDIQYERMAGVGDREYMTVTVPYMEVI